MEHPSTFSKLRRLTAVCAVFGLMLTIGSVSCRKDESTDLKAKGAGNFDRPRAEQEYRLIETELRVAEEGIPYLVIDLEKGRLLLKLKGAVIWNYPMNFATADSANVSRFLLRFRGSDGKVARPLADKHLFSALGKTSDSVLAIVGEVVNVDPELLQRDIPQRFQLHWDDGLYMEVQTDIIGQPVSVLKNAVVQFRQALDRPFGEALIVLKIDPEEALTLYRAASEGMPTLIYPSH